MDKYTGLQISDEDTHIRQSIADILTTQIGTRIQRRDYGSNIPKLLDRPISRILMLQLAAAAITAITKWEPRAKIKQFKPVFEGNKIKAHIVITNKSTGNNISYDNIL